jgi:glycerol-3-phosphate cytidylyltransferase
MKRGFTAGCFDLLHAGHCMMLKEARLSCDHLTVFLQTDPTIDRPDTKAKPTQSLPERLVQLEAIRWVDDVKIYQTEQELIEWLTLESYDVRIIGADYKNKSFTGDDLPHEVVYNSRDHAFSTTELRQRVAQNSRPDTTHRTQEVIREVEVIKEVPVEVEKTVEKYIDRPIVQAKMAAGKSFEEIVDEDIPDMKFMSYVYEAKNA